MPDSSKLSYSSFAIVDELRRLDMQCLVLKQQPLPSWHGSLYAVEGGWLTTYSTLWLRVAVYDTDRTNPNPNPNPTRHNQPLVSSCPFVD